MPKGSDGVQKYLTAKYILPDASAGSNPTTGEPEVHVNFDAEGTLLFGKITERLVDKTLTVFLDDKLIMQGTVKEHIPSDECTITVGSGGIERATNLAQQLCGGGGAALYDATAYAFDKLRERNDVKRINVVLVMTDERKTSGKRLSWDFGRRCTLYYEPGWRGCLRLCSGSPPLDRRCEPHFVIGCYMAQKNVGVDNVLGSEAS